MNLKNILIILLLSLCIGNLFAQEPYFKYERKNTDKYFSEMLMEKAPSSNASKKVATIMKKEVMEIAEKDWGFWPFFSHDVNTHSSSGRKVYMEKPDELLIALSMAYPLLDKEGKQAALKAADREYKLYPPFKVPCKTEAKNIRGHGNYPTKNIEDFKNAARPSWGSEKMHAFKSLYGVWAYAEQMNRWDKVKKDWPKIKALKNEIASQLKPLFVKKTAMALGIKDKGRNRYVYIDPLAVLTKEMAKSKAYKMNIKHRTMFGIEDYYNNPRKRDQDRQKGRGNKRFTFTKELAALIGYGRIAAKMGDKNEVKWAKDKYTEIAKIMFGTFSGFQYCCSEWLTPEVARMIRDTAGTYLDEINETSHIFKLTDKDGCYDKGPWIRVIEPYMWYQAQMGSNGGMAPGHSMAGFLAKAWLFNEPAKKLDNWIDVPWCQADYFFVEKCAITINTYEKAKWNKIKGSL